MVDPNKDPVGALIHAVRGLSQVVQSLGVIYQIPAEYTGPPVERSMALVVIIEQQREEARENERRSDPAPAA
jgi:hypothetical protein